MESGATGSHQSLPGAMVQSPLRQGARREEDDVPEGATTPRAPLDLPPGWAEKRYSGAATHNEHSSNAAVYQSGMNGIVLNLINTKLAPPPAGSDQEETPTEAKPGTVLPTVEVKVERDHNHDDRYDDLGSGATSQALEDALAQAILSFQLNGLERLMPIQKRRELDAKNLEAEKARKLEEERLEAQKAQELEAAKKGKGRWLGF